MWYLSWGRHGRWGHEEVRGQWVEVRKRNGLRHTVFHYARKFIDLISFKPHFNSMMNVLLLLLPQVSHLGIGHTSIKSWNLNPALLSPQPTAPYIFTSAKGDEKYGIETQEFTFLYLWKGPVVFIYLCTHLFIA